MANNGAATVATQIPASNADLPQAPAAAPPARTRLGEELPIFCEKCGYSLHGLIQLRCQSCNLLHFSCPECGHHQPINTLRPAFQRALGRLRALGLALIVFLKINFFFWPLMIWGAVGTELAYEYKWNPGLSTGSYGPADFETEEAIITFLFAGLYAGIGRMLLLRWRTGVLVGLAMGGVLVLALSTGALLQQSGFSQPLPSPFHPAFVSYLMCAFTGAVAGAACVWGIWLALAHAFLPKRAAAALLEWQRAMSAPAGARDRTDPRTSVTV